MTCSNTLSKKQDVRGKSLILQYRGISGGLAKQWSYYGLLKACWDPTLLIGAIHYSPYPLHQSFSGSFYKPGKGDLQ